MVDTRQQTLSIQQALDLAVEHHSAGRLREAEGIYQQILKADPKQPVALHLLGVIAHQMGTNDIAVDLITKALAIKPDYAEAYNNLGYAFNAQGKLDEAVSNYHKALAINPDYAEAHNNLGNIIQDLGRRDEAFKCHRRAIVIDPENGVLHHLSDPLAGWRILVDLLKPGGLMKIGLYSEAARQVIIRGRALIAERGYAASPDEIRACRQDLIVKADGGDSEIAAILNFRDFFSLSECRDLLFHVQEHRFTLPQIEGYLKSLNLEFLGFEMGDQRSNREFRKLHPQKSAVTSLSHWHKFELDNSDTFLGMYQFWCKKI